MNIGVIGTGYVGLVSSVCLANSGHSLVCIDKRTEIIAALQQGIPTIFEKDMDSMLSSCVTSGSISFSTDVESLKACELIFLAVGTPSLPNGHADLSQVFSAIDALISVVSRDTMIAVRSTVPVGTVQKVRTYLDGKGRAEQILGFCPEFLREGVAISDFRNPQYLVFASEKKEGQDLLHKAYQNIIDATDNEVRVVKTASYETAELIKYTINSFLATKITFMNQISQLAQASNADVGDIIHAISADKRIGDLFLNPGPGFGGSCFPKDTIALTKCGRSYGVDMSVVEEVHIANQKHKEYIASWILETLEKKLTVEHNTIAIWGLAFKSGTDDVRDSSAITIAESFFNRNITVQAYDPQGNENFRHMVNNEKLRLFNNPLDAVKGADVLVVLTEWSEFKEVSAAEVLTLMNGDAPFVFDTRGIISRSEYHNLGFQVHHFGL